MNSKKVGDFLDLLFPNPQCELNYNTDYELLLAIMLSAQTTDKRVNMVTSVLFDKYQSLSDLKNAPIDDLEAILRPIGSFRKKSIYLKEISRILDDDYNGIVPKSREILETFPGVGRKTCNVFLAEFYNEAAIAVDTHVARVSKRLGIAKMNDDVSVIEKKLMKFFPKEDWAKRHLQMVLFGRYYCKAIKPECNNCHLYDICKEKKKTKKEK